MDVSFRCYPSLFPSQDLDVHPAVKSGATEELPGQQPLHRGSRTYYAQILKNSRDPRGNIKGQERPPGTVSFVSTGADAHAEVSGWYQRPVQAPAHVDPAASRSLQATLPGPACAEPRLSREHTLNQKPFPYAHQRPPWTSEDPPLCALPATCPHTCTHSVCTHTMHIQSVHTWCASHCVHAHVHMQHEHTKSVHKICTHTVCIHVYTKVNTKWIHTLLIHTVCSHTCTYNVHMQHEHTQHTHTTCTHAHTERPHAVCQHIQQVLRVSALCACPAGCFTHQCACTHAVHSSCSQHTHGRSRPWADKGPSKNLGKHTHTPACRTQ